MFSTLSAKLHDAKVTRDLKVTHWATPPKFSAGFKKNLQNFSIDVFGKFLDTRSIRSIIMHSSSNLDSNIVWKLYQNQTAKFNISYFIKLSLTYAWFRVKVISW